MREVAWALAALAAGVAWNICAAPSQEPFAELRVQNASGAPLILPDGGVVPSGGASVIYVPAGTPGSILGCEYPAIGAGAAHCLRITPQVKVEDAIPNTGGIARESGAARDGTPNGFQSFTEGVESTIVEMGDYIGVPLELYELVSPYIGKEERAAVIRRMNARWPGKAWIPRKYSTVFGSLEKLVDTLKVFDDASTVGEIAGTAYLAIKAGKSPSQIADMFSNTDLWQGSRFGEAAYWTAAIITGMINGRTFMEAIEDAFDSDNAGFWTTAGYEIGAAYARAHQAFEKWMSEDERQAMDMLLLEKLRAAGYGEEAEKAFVAWLALDSDIRATTPFALKDEWRTNPPPTGAVCEAPAQGKKGEGNDEAPAGTPCFSCMFGDLYGTCSTPGCPNYGNKHSAYRR